MENVVKLVGIARSAAEGSRLTTKRRVEYRTLPTRKWLNRCQSDRVPFDWTINPYRGCEFGCKYCYARFTHDFMERRAPDAFETEIYAKTWDSRSFRHELASLRPGSRIGIGTATDPYQPIERTQGLTRQLLDCMRYVQGVSLFLTTKSDLVARDIDVLKALTLHNHLHVTVTVTTTDRKLARLTEPFAPRPDLRLHAVSQLASAGIPVGVIANPVLPLITDSEDNLESVARAAKDAGADQFGANVLFLMPAAQRTFFPFLAENFPQHLKRYQASFAEGAYLHGKYPERIRALVENIRERVGLPSREAMRMPFFEQANPQLSLFC